jgi:Domain of unknown function (DUF3943)
VLSSPDVLRPVLAFLVLVSLSLAGTPASAEETPDSSAWWTQVAADAPEKFHLLPDNTLEPRDWVGLARDTAFLLGYQIVGAGILYLVPESVSNWSEANKDASAEKWWDHVRNPEWDEDDWPVNYIGHSYFGATYYIRARERGFDRVDSFLYSALASAAYEFGVEAFFERPSYQDLIVTPIGGALLGGFVFEPLRNWVKHKSELKWYDHAILIATDPIGALNYVAESLLGIKSDIRVGVPRGGGIMVELRLPWR